MKKRNPTRRIRRGGFTLIEVLLVLAILGVIAAMVVPNLIGQQQESYIKTTKLAIDSLESELTRYAVNHDGVYPESLEVLVQPETRSNGQTVQPYLPEIPKDAWGMPLRYEPPSQSGEKPLIWSTGPDKQEGGKDDISNMDDQQDPQI